MDVQKNLKDFWTTNFFNKLGGKPIDRVGNMNSVDRICKMFERNVTLRLAIAPEGTRKLVNHWKTGFYHIALKTNCQILPVAFDWKKREVKLFNPFKPTHNQDQDIKFLKSLFVGVKGKIEGNSVL